MKQTRTRKGLCRLAALLPLMAAAPASPDTVKLTNGLVYDRVTIIAVAGGTIRFRTAAAQPTKSLRDLALVKLTGEEGFNRAEELLAAGRYAEAAKAYSAAGKVTGTAWKRTLIRYRRMSAAEAAGAIDEAIRLWLVLADEARGVKGVLELRPRKLAPKASQANERAIALLNAKAARVKAKPYRTAILEALVDVYERQGRLVEAQALQARLAGRTTRPGARNGGGPSPGADGRPGASANAGLRLAGLLLKRDQFEKVVSTVEPTLKRLEAADLPSALYMLGRAQLELAKRRKDKKAARDLSLEGGLNLMRVVVFFGGAGEAPYALLLAGQANENLGNFAAARAAYSTVISRFSASSSAKSAEAALERIKKK